MPDSQMEKAKVLGFDKLDFDTQWIVFNKGRMFGWEGATPKVLGSASANKVLDEVLDYLLAQGVKFERERQS